MTVRKLNLERLSACHNKAHGTHSAALKWKITSPGHTPASSLPPRSSWSSEVAASQWAETEKGPFHSSCSASVDDDCEALLLPGELKGIALPLWDTGQSLSCGRKPNKVQWGHGGADVSRLAPDATGWSASPGMSVGSLAVPRRFILFAETTRS